MAITTKYLYDLYANTNELGIPNIRVESIISGVCDAIEQRCNRTFGTATYQEWVDGSQDNFMFLKNYPITAIKRVSDCSINVMNITNTGNEYAAVTCDSTGITPNTTDSSGVETETTLLYADYVNVGDLNTAINLIATWSSEVISGYDSKLTALIKPKWGENIYDNENIQLTVPYQAVPVRVANQSNNAIERTDGCSFTGGKSNVYVNYTAGYTLPVDNSQHSALTVDGNVPAGLTLVANMICKDVIDGVSGDKNMQTETIGNYNYDRSSILSCIDRHWADLQPYALKVI